jgi:hypothetical protein
MSKFTNEDKMQECGSQTCSRTFEPNPQKGKVNVQLYCSKPCSRNESMRRKKWRKNFGSTNHPFTEGPDTRKLRGL